MSPHVIVSLTDVPHSEIDKICSFLIIMAQNAKTNLSIIHQRSLREERYLKVFRGSTSSPGSFVAVGEEKNKLNYLVILWYKCKIWKSSDPISVQNNTGELKSIYIFLNKTTYKITINLTVKQVFFFFFYQLKMCNLLKQWQITFCKNGIKNALGWNIWGGTTLLVDREK